MVDIFFSGDGYDDLTDAPDPVTDEVVRVLTAMENGARNYRRVVTNAHGTPFHYFEVDPDGASDPYTVLVELDRSYTREDELRVRRIDPSSDIQV